MSDEEPQEPAQPVEASPVRAREVRNFEGRTASALVRGWQMLDRAHELDAALGTRSENVATLVREFGIGRHRAKAALAAVVRRRMMEGRLESEAQRTARYRATLEDIVRRALSLKVTVCTNREAGEYEVVEQPDLKAATAATLGLLKTCGALDRNGASPLEPPALPSDAVGARVIVLSAEEANAELARRRKAGEL